MNMTSWGTQCAAYFIGLWLHYPEYCLLRCVSISWLLWPRWILVYLKVVERSRISTEDITFSFRAAPTPTFLRSIPVWRCHLKWNCLLKKEDWHRKSFLGQRKTSLFRKLIIRLMLAWGKDGWFEDANGLLSCGLPIKPPSLRRLWDFGKPECLLSQNASLDWEVTWCCLSMNCVTGPSTFFAQSKLFES